MLESTERLIKEKHLIPERSRGRVRVHTQPVLAGPIAHVSGKASGRADSAQSLSGSISAIGRQVRPGKRPRSTHKGIRPTDRTSVTIGYDPQPR
jgi:hypothetical protein